MPPPRQYRLIVILGNQDGNDRLPLVAWAYVGSHLWSFVGKLLARIHQKFRCKR